MVKYKPYEGSGIQNGDIIVKINEKEITCTNDLTNCINETKENEMKVRYVRNQEIIETKIKPIKTNDNLYKIGLWVRDTAAGVGTSTFYEPNSGKFACLGHGIIDPDTEGLVEIATGEIVTANVLSIAKGTNGNPRKNTRNNRRKAINRNNIQKYKSWIIWILKQYKFTINK